MLQSGCESGDAFRVMIYKDEAGNLETIWNSRDGVTPFIVRSKQGLESRHIAWGNDRFEPYYVPPIGSRIFIDLTMEKALESRARYYDRMSNDIECGPDFKKYYPDRDAAIRALAEEDMASFAPHTPDLVEVTSEMHAIFSARAKANWTPRRFG